MFTYEKKDLNISVKDFLAKYGNEALKIREKDNSIRDLDSIAQEMAFIAEKEQEEFWVVTLNNQHEVIKKHMITRGTLTETIVHPRDVFRVAFLDNAAAIFVAHNHPGGDPTPSQQDIATTKRLKEVAQIMGIRFLDHVVISSKGFRKVI